MYIPTSFSYPHADEKKWKMDAVPLPPPGGRTHRGVGKYNPPPGGALHCQIMAIDAKIVVKKNQRKKKYYCMKKRREHKNGQFW